MNPQTIITDCQTIVRNTIAYIADRYERRPHYPWIDTKFNIITGADFPPDDPIRGPQTIYAWIQGRALEALAGHARYLNQQPDPASKALAKRLTPILKSLLTQLLNARNANQGRLFFWLDQAGRPILIQAGQQIPHTITPDAPYNFSDIFCAKGFYAAAQYLQNPTATAQAREYCHNVFQATRTGNFLSDQQPLDPKNPVTPVPHRHSHGQWMIQLGAAALLTQHEPDTQGIDMTLEILDHILNRHVNIDAHLVDLQDYDFIEFIDDQHQPYRTQEAVLSDPGHALEFVGLALRATRTARAHPNVTPNQLHRLSQAERHMPHILIRNFNNGFNPNAAGICKLYDLTHRKPLNTDMPWWPLPETMRAAAYCTQLNLDPTRTQQCQSILTTCHQAFTTHYVKPDRHYFQVQTRAADGDTIDVIPATPDARPRLPHQPIPHRHPKPPTNLNHQPPPAPPLARRPVGGFAYVIPTATQPTYSLQSTPARPLAPLLAGRFRPPTSHPHLTPSPPKHYLPTSHAHLFPKIKSWPPKTKPARIPTQGQTANSHIPPANLTSAT